MILRLAVLGLLLGCSVRCFADWTASDSAKLSAIEDNTYFTKTAAESASSQLIDTDAWLHEELSKWRAGGSQNEDGRGATLRYVLWETMRHAGLMYTNDINIRNSLYISPQFYSQLPAAYRPEPGSFISSQWNLTTNLSTFLFGSLNGPWYSQYPQFRFLTRSSSLTTPPGDTMVNQSLVNFLNFTLGQNVDYGSGTPANMSWEAMFTTNSIYRKTLSASNQTKMGYGLFNLWLAEAQRRLIANTSNTAARVGELTETPQDWYSASSNAVVASPSENDFELERPDGVDWFGDDLIEGPEWTLAGAAINPVVYSDTSRGYTLRLSFEGWGPICRALCSFLVYVGTAVCMVGIIKTEVDYWTTLGGSAT